jgi:hypothetical protein
MISGRRAAKQRGGTSFVEFTLVGIPLIFVLVSTFELARGMWNYHALNYAVKEGTRFASLHGKDCSTSPNACTKTVADITQFILNNGAGLPSNGVTLTFTTAGGTITCLASNCLSNASVWPPSPNNAVGSAIQISGTYLFQSAISMFWPGAGSGVTAGTVNLPASSTETVQF